MSRQELVDALVATFDGTQPDGVVVAATVVEPDGAAFAGSTPAAVESVFEFGSITKALTGTLLAALVLRGDVTLDASIGNWIAAGPNGDITLLELATHTSGLARLAPNAIDHDGFDKTDPYAAFTPELAEVGLRAVERADAGTHLYSNFGFQLLGLCLERAGGATYAELMHREVFGPLGMTSARVGSGRAVHGHAAAGEVVPHWSQPLAAAGGTNGTVGDLAKLAFAVLRSPVGPLGEVLAMATAPRAEGHNRKWGLGWVLLVADRVWHNGGTAGFSSTIVVDRRRERAVAVLANVGDLTDALDRAALLAVDGRDPSPARPVQPSTEPAGEEFAGAARAFAAALTAEDYAGAVARFDAKAAETLTAERLREVWSQTVAQLGAVAEVSGPAAAVRPFGAASRVDITFERGALALHTAHNENAAIIGVLLVGPDDPPPF